MIPRTESGAVGTNPIAQAGLFRALEAQPGAESQALTTLLHAIDDLRHEVRASRGSGRGLHGIDTTRLLLPPNQYMYSSLADFLMRDTALAGERFVLEVKDGRVDLSVLPDKLSGAEKIHLNYTFALEPDIKLGDEVNRIKAAISRDLDGLSPDSATSVGTVKPES